MFHAAMELDEETDKKDHYQTLRQILRRAAIDADEECEDQGIEEIGMKDEEDQEADSDYTGNDHPIYLKDVIAAFSSKLDELHQQRG